MEVPWEAGLSYLVGVLSFLVALGTPVLAVHGIEGDLPEKEDLYNEYNDELRGNLKDWVLHNYFRSTFSDKSHFEHIHLGPPLHPPRPRGPPNRLP